MIGRTIRRLRRRLATAPEPAAVTREAERAPVPPPVLSNWEYAKLAALAEERARASDGAAEWGTILATGLRAMMPDRVGDADMALVLLHVDGFLASVLESQDDYQGAVMALGDGLRLGAAELAAMELALLAADGGELR